MSLMVSVDVKHHVYLLTYGAGGEVRTQRLVHDEGDVYTAGGRGAGGGAVSRWCKMTHLASSPLGCSQGSGP